MHFGLGLLGVLHFVIDDFDNFTFNQQLYDIVQLLFRKLLEKQGIDGAAQSFDFLRLGRFSSGKVIDDGVDSFRGGYRFVCLSGEYIRDRIEALANDFLCLEMLDERVEAGVLGDDVEQSTGVFVGQPANVVGDVKVQGIAAVAFNLDVFGIRPKGLEGASDVDGDFGLLGAEKYLDLVGAALQKAQVFGLYILKINEHEIEFQGDFRWVTVPPY